MSVQINQSMNILVPLTHVGLVRFRRITGFVEGGEILEDVMRATNQ
jgi:hypothetical protein